MELAVELVNSQPLLGDPDDLSDLEQLREFLARHLPSVDRDVTEADLAAVHEVRATLRAAFLADTQRVAADALNDVLRGAGATLQLDDHDGSWHLHVVAQDPGPAARIAAVAAASMAMVLADYGLERLGICASDTCIDAFVDTTKNRSRRYCSDGCANVSAVRSFRARASEQSGG